MNPKNGWGKCVFDVEFASLSFPDAPGPLFARSLSQLEFAYESRKRFFVSREKRDEYKIHCHRARKAQSNSKSCSDRIEEKYTSQKQRTEKW